MERRWAKRSVHLEQHRVGERADTSVPSITGNLRLLATMGNELLATAARRELPQIDQKLYFEVYASEPRARSRRGSVSRDVLA